MAKSRPRAFRDRPLADPARARFVRAALNRRDQRREQEALQQLAADPDRFARTIERIQELQLLLAEPE